MIDKYGPNNEDVKWPYFIARGPNNELVSNNSIDHLVVFDENLQYLHVISGRGNGNRKFQLISGIAIENRG